MSRCGKLNGKKNENQNFTIFSDFYDKLKLNTGTQNSKRKFFNFFLNNSDIFGGFFSSGMFECKIERKLKLRKKRKKIYSRF